MTVVYGLLIGLAFTLLFLLSPLPNKPLGFHAGVIGLALNMMVVFFHQYRYSPLKK